MNATKVSLPSGGMVCAVGHTAAAACAAIRAGLCGFQDLPYPDDKGEPHRGAPVPGLPWFERSIDRLSALLSMAVGDCLAGAPSLGPDPLPLLVGIAEPGRPGGLIASRAAVLLEDVERSLNVRLHPTLSGVIAAGHVAVFRALATARNMVTGGAAPACLVAGVDSYLNAASLRWLNTHFRLKTPTNSDGVIPGEAASCVLVERRARSGGISIGLVGLGFGHEPAGIMTEEPPLLARGMVAASRGALAEAGLALNDIDLRISDVAGEGYAFKEMALTLQKLQRVRTEAAPLWHPAEAIGDTGAAAGACQIVTAIHAFQKGYVPGPRALLHGSAVGGDRATALLEGRS